MRSSHEVQRDEEDVDRLDADEHGPEIKPVAWVNDVLSGGLETIRPAVPARGEGGGGVVPKGTAKVAFLTA